MLNNAYRRCKVMHRCMLDCIEPCATTWTCCCSKSQTSRRRTSTQMCCHTVTVNHDVQCQAVTGNGVEDLTPCQHRTAPKEHLHIKAYWTRISHVRNGNTQFLDAHTACHRHNTRTTTAEDASSSTRSRTLLQCISIAKGP